MNLDRFLDFGKGISQTITEATLSNDTKFMVKYYQADGDCFFVDDRQQTLLHLATRNKNKEAVELLLLIGLDPNQGDKYEETPLHIASYMGSIEIATVLLQYHASPNKQNTTLQTPLHKACFKGSVDVITLLISYEADIYAIDENHSTIMQYAVRSKKIKAVKYLAEHGAIVNSFDIRKQSTLHYAALYSTVEIVQYLIDYGVNPYSKDQYLSTPLHLAVEHPHIEMVEILLQYGLTSYDKNKFNNSPYDVANIKSRYESIELFNKLKNDAEYQSRLKRNMLCLSIVMNEFDRADSLINIVNVNDRDIFGNTALFYAIMNNEPYLVERLLQQDASIYNIDRMGDDAIYYATIIGNIEIITLIQQKQVQYDKKYAGYTIFEYAMKLHDITVYETLKKGSNL